MVTIDAGRWPLVVIAVAGPVTSATTDGYLAAFDRCLVRHEPFAVVLDFRHVEESASQSAGANTHMQWINRTRESMQAYCRGIAYVLASPEQVEHARATVAKAAAGLWGCAVEPCTSLDEGIAWATRQLGDSAAERAAAQPA